MAKEVWGTFSVKDHLEPRAFVAEVLLYDRLVIPVPPYSESEQRGQWAGQGWRPDRLDKLLTILGDRARPVQWDAAWRQIWRDRHEGTRAVADRTGETAFQMTRDVLLQGLPSYVTGVQAVANYASLPDLSTDLGLRPSSKADLHGTPGLFTAILGHEFLYPEDPRRNHEDLLEQAVALSKDRAFVRKRAAFWRWQREFLNDKGIADGHAIKAAVEEMRENLEEVRAALRKEKILTGSRYAFLIGSVGLGFMGAGSTGAMVAAAGGAFLSVGQFIADRILDAPAAEARPASLFHDARRHFGWNDR